MLDRPAKALARSEQDDEAALLSRCPFVDYIPPLDVDVNEDSASYEPIAARALAIDYARRLAAAAEVVGLGRPVWYRTNLRGGLHGDLLPPPGLASPFLLLATGDLVRRAAKLADVPVLSLMPWRRSDRPSVVLDDTNYNRRADSRGVVWRLVGAAKPDKPPKTPVDLWRDDLPDRPDDIDPTPGDPARDAEALRETERLESLRPPSRRPVGDPRPVSRDDLRFVFDHGKIAELWERSTVHHEDGAVDRSRRDASFALRCLFHGASDDLVARLLWSMPGGKASEDHRDARYVERTIAWAARTLDANPRLHLKRWANRSGITPPKVPTPYPQSGDPPPLWVQEDWTDFDQPPPGRVRADAFRSRPPPDDKTERKRSKPNLDAADRAYLHQLGCLHFGQAEHPTRLRLFHVVGCGLSVIEMRCPEPGHGVDHERHLVCGLQSLCPYCAWKRADKHADHVAEHWPDDGQGIWACVFHTEETDPSAGLQDLRRTRALLRSAYPVGLGYRWLLGSRRGAIFFSALRADAYFQHADAVDGLERLGVTNYRLVKLTRAEASDLVRDLWYEPAKHFLDLVRARDHEAVISFPYLWYDDPTKRSDCSRADDHFRPLEWLNESELRLALVADARRRRGGAASNSCSHGHESQAPCGRTLHPVAVDLRDDEVLYVGRAGEATWRTAGHVFAALTAKRSRIVPPSPSQAVNSRTTSARVPLLV